LRTLKRVFRTGIEPKAKRIRTHMGWVLRWLKKLSIMTIDLGKGRRKERV